MHGRARGQAPWLHSADWLSGEAGAGSADSSHKIQGLQRQTGRKLKIPRSCSKWFQAALKDKATTEPFHTSGFRKVMLPF